MLNNKKTDREGAGCGLGGFQMEAPVSVLRLSRRLALYGPWPTGRVRVLSQRPLVTTAAHRPWPATSGAAAARLAAGGLCRTCSNAVRTNVGKKNGRSEVGLLL